MPTTATFLCSSSPRIIDKNLAHHPRSNREEMGSAIELALTVLRQSYIGRMKRCRRVERVLRPFASQVPCSDAAQVTVQRPHQLIQRGLIFLALYSRHYNLPKHFR